MDLDPRHSTWQGLLGAMRENRDEDLPRELLAEHLADEHGPGVTALERFIRQSLEYARYDPENQLAVQGWDQGQKFGSNLWMRQSELSALLSVFWRPLLFDGTDLPQHLQNLWRWHRGFPEQVVVTFDWWTHYADKLCSIGPVGEVFIVSMPPMGSTQMSQTNRREYWVRDGLVNRRAGGSNGVVVELDANGHAGQRTIRTVAETILRGVWREGVEVTSLQIDEGMNLILDGG